jgi:isoleucyl-tRNA synthetase
MLDAYDTYDYPTIFQAVNAFATVDLSAFYSDISKDRLYTFGARSNERRSAQTAMYAIAEGMARLIAPILSVTAEQLWEHLPKNVREESVHLALFPNAPDLEKLVDANLLERWERLIKLREQVLAEIEPLRKNKQIGSSLQAKVVISDTPQVLAQLKEYEADLPMLFIVSEVELRAGAERRISIERASGVKCERCWRYVKTVSTDPAWAGICDRCQDALAQTTHA